MRNDIEKIRQIIADSSYSVLITRERITSLCDETGEIRKWSETQSKRIESLAAELERAMEEISITNDALTIQLHETPDDWTTERISKALAYLQDKMESAPTNERKSV